MDSRGSRILETQLDVPRSPPRLLAHWLIFVSLAVVITAFDLWTKQAVFDLLGVKIVSVRMENGLERKAVEPHEHYVIIPGFFELEANINYGAFSGWFHNNTGLLRALSVLALLVVPCFLVSHLRGPGPHGFWFTAALGLLWGGTAGNLYDRAVDGYVRDFIKWFFVWNGTQHVWPNFNVADSAICVGVGIIVVLMLLESRSRKKEPASRGAAS
jgi:signal peptidase II